LIVWLTPSLRTIHLALFIIACIAVHRWRRTRYGNLQAAQIIYVQQPILQQPMMVAQPGAAPGGAPMLVPIPQNGSLPPPPPGMAYLVPVPQQQEQQQDQAAAQQQYPNAAQDTANAHNRKEDPLEVIPEINTTATQDTGA
jgi:hypothetical protein